MTHAASFALIFGRGRCAIRAPAILPDAKSIPTLFAHAKLRRLLDVDDSAWLARVGIEHGHLTREAAC
jgi:hypothetical protein